MVGELSDRELVVAAQSGDKRAIAALLERHQALVMRLALRMVGQPEVARELAQEAMLEAFLSVRHLRRADRFQSWLYGITLNVCRTYLRRQRMDLCSLEAMQGGLALETLPFTSAEPDPQRVAETRELHELVMAAVNDLSPKNRAAVLLFYYEDLSVAETAALLGISVAAVKGRLHKARRTLYETLVTPDRRAMLESRRAQHQVEQERKANMPAETFVHVSIIDVLRQEESDHSIVILAEQEGRRLLPIWIGAFEAEAIAMHLLGKETARPLTFAFMANLLQAAGIELERVTISALRENTFYATVTLRTGDGVQEVDARPSDAMALALHLDCPLYVAEDVMAGSDLTQPAEHESKPTGQGLAKFAAMLEERGQQHQREMAALKERTEQRSVAEKQADREKLLAALYGEGE